MSSTFVRRKWTGFPRTASIVISTSTTAFGIGFLGISIRACGGPSTLIWTPNGRKKKAKISIGCSPHKARRSLNAFTTRDCRAEWLSLVGDPQIHRPHPLETRWTLLSLATLLLGKRCRDLLRLIQEHFLNCFAGNAYFDEYARVYSQSWIGFNCSVKNDINMRVYETLGCGTLLLTNDLCDNGMDELLVSGSAPGDVPRTGGAARKN